MVTDSQLGVNRISCIFNRILYYPMYLCKTFAHNMTTHTGVFNGIRMPRLCALYMVYMSALLRMLIMGHFFVLC